MASLSKERLYDCIKNNLECLQKILEYNVANGIYHFRITSDLIPFASHPKNKFHWQDRFKKQFRSIGKFINRHKIRISMHPDQFTLINSIDEDVYKRSCKELLYHANVMDLMGLNKTAKIQIHVGGVYGDRGESIRRFIERYFKLDRSIKKRLVIENDDRLYSLKDCLEIYDAIKIPIVLDSFHHSILNRGESLKEALCLTIKTWGSRDGPPIVDYSCQQLGARRGTHALSIDIKSFKALLEIALGLHLDIMLEIKDKEKSALIALEILKEMDVGEI